MLTIQHRLSILALSASLTACATAPASALGRTALSNSQVSNTSQQSTTITNKQALVIGNAHYSSAPLRNPINDAKAIKVQLEQLGFQVLYYEDIKTRKEFSIAIRQFRKRINAQTLAYVYYSGHAQQIDDINYLLPTELKAEKIEDIEDDSATLQYLLKTIRSNNAAMILASLDACRDNPFPKKNRGSDRGMAQLQLKDVSARELISFATQPNHVANDGNSNHSPYTAALLSLLAQKGKTLFQVFNELIPEVLLLTHNQQMPLNQSTYIPDICLTGDCIVELIETPAESRLQAMEQKYSAIVAKQDRNNNYLKENCPKQLDFWRQQAQQGSPIAQYFLGGCYYTGSGVKKDDAEAVIWDRKAAEQGYANAQYNLGVMYENGRGVKQDDAEAVAWFRKAAEQGYASAQYNLGVFYQSGRGVKQDDAEAVAWYRKAAEQGNKYAKEALARF